MIGCDKIQVKILDELNEDATCSLDKNGRQSK